MKDSLDRLAWIVAAAGKGSRLGADRPKAFVSVEGIPLVVWTVRRLASARLGDRVVIALPRGHRHALDGMDLGPWPFPPTILEGGATRRASVLNAIDAIAAMEDIDWIGIHDGARPLVSARLVRDVFEQAKRTGCAAPGRPVSDSLGRTLQNGWESVRREGLFQIQTPQIFERKRLVQTLAGLDAMDLRDEATALQAEGVDVSLVPGNPSNIKVTTPVDLAFAAQQLASATGHGHRWKQNWRSGIGFDAHRLVAGRPLKLGGVPIEYPRGLEGHSDGDVLCHAVADALLSAARLGDLGHHFPSDDPKWKGVSGPEILARTAMLLDSAGWRPESVDAVVICQQPTVAPYRYEMENNMAHALGMQHEGSVTVKATSTDGLGFTGRGEGVAAQALVVVSKRDDVRISNRSETKPNNEDTP